MRSRRKPNSDWRNLRFRSPGAGGRLYAPPHAPNNRVNREAKSVQPPPRPLPAPKIRPIVFRRRMLAPLPRLRPQWFGQPPALRSDGSPRWRRGKPCIRIVSPCRTPILASRPYRRPAHRQAGAFAGGLWPGCWRWSWRRGFCRRGWIGRCIVPMPRAS